MLLVSGSSKKKAFSFRGAIKGTEYTNFETEKYSVISCPNKREKKVLKITEFMRRNQMRK